MITIAIPYYQSRSKEREIEFQIAAIENLSCEYLTELIVVTEKKEHNIGIEHPRLRHYCVRQRQTYNDLIRILNKTSSDVKIIANADIFFTDPDLLNIVASLREDQCYALSRWDLFKNGNVHLHAHPDSQDAWVFRGDIRGINGNIQFGIPGCDNRIAYEIASAGYRVLNPCKTIRSFHVHNSKKRTYNDDTKRIEPPYKLVKPTWLHQSEEEANIEELSAVPTVEDFKSMYDYGVQKKRMEEQLQHFKDPAWDLAIVIPSIYTRQKMLTRLTKELYKQIYSWDVKKTKVKVRIYTEVDGGLLPIGSKRNELTMKADAKFIMNWDDDDMPKTDAVKRIVDKIVLNPDVDAITIELGVYNKDGDDWVKTGKTIYGEADQKRDISDYIKDGKSMTVIKNPPGHLCAIRKDIMLQVPFRTIWGNGGDRKKRGDNGSDVKHLTELQGSGLIKTTAHVPGEIYEYLYDQNK